MQPVDIQTAYRIQTESALSVGQPSEPSKTVLRRLGLLDWFDEEPVAVLAELHGGLSPAGDDDRLFALAELSFLHAERTGDRAHFLASAVYAWALLFRTTPPACGSSPRIPDYGWLTISTIRPSPKGWPDLAMGAIRAVPFPTEWARCDWSRGHSSFRSGRSRLPWTNPACRGVDTGLNI